MPRLIRVLVYEGSETWINDCRMRMAVKGSYVCPNGVIREAVIGDFIEPFDHTQVAPEVRAGLETELARSEDYFPDNNDQRDGYTQGIQFALDLITQNKEQQDA